MAETGKDEEDREIVYHYSREHRLERASAQVRTLNEDPSKIIGIGKRRSGNRSNIFVMICIITVMIVVAITGKSGRLGGLKIGANEIKLSLVKTDDELSLEIKKTIPPGAYAYTGAVLVAVSPVQKKPAPGAELPPPQVMADRIFFTFTDEENYSFVIPFDGEEFVVILESENERVIQRLKKPR